MNKDLDSNRQYSVQVIRTYTTCDTFEISASSPEEAARIAEKMSDNIDHRHKLQLADLEIDILEELEN